MLYDIDTTCNEKCKCSICMMNGYCTSACCRCAKEEAVHCMKNCEDFILSYTRLKDKLKRIKMLDMIYHESYRNRTNVLLLPAPKNNC